MSSKSFCIDIDWREAPDERPEEVRKTAGFLTITIDKKIATRNTDTSGKKKSKDRAYLSAYPLAEWMVLSWWRLLYEVDQEKKEGDLFSSGWAQSHAMSSAGYGYLWPDIIFAPDGKDRISVYCAGGDAPQKISGIHYNSLNDTLLLERKSLKKGMTDFIDRTINRLVSEGIRDTDLHVVWDDIKKEYQHKDHEKYRIIEAMLGFDPDEVSPDLIQSILGHEQDLGWDALQEFAAGLNGSVPPLGTDIFSFLHEGGIRGKFSNQLRRIDSRHRANSKPWRVGQELAHDVRKLFNLGDKPIESALLAEIVGMDEHHLLDNTSPHDMALSVATRDREDFNNINVYFSTRHPTSKRFHTARFIADNIEYNPQKWLLATNAKTPRQAIQRAFAANFICPLDAIRKGLGKDYTEAEFDDFTKYYGVSPEMLRSHINNNHRSLSYLKHA